MEEKKPFHETIIGAIESIDVKLPGVYDQLYLLARLIKATKIPANHDAISKVWVKKCKERSMVATLGVVDHLIEQRRVAEEEARQKQERERRLLCEDALER